MPLPVYLDCNATTPVEPQVAEAVLHFLTSEYGNAASRTHEFGAVAKRAVESARDAIAQIVRAQRDEVLFTSGATESDNLAILGLLAHGAMTGRRHLVSTAIEHKAVLEPLEEARRRGFEVTLIQPCAGGWVSAEQVRDALRPDTLLVSVMHANNETGVLQPILEIAEVLQGHEAFFHVDAAQTFGKELLPLRSPRVDLLSVSAHKIYGPKGIGALIARRRGFRRAPLEPILFGGGHERGLRPGTLPVPLIAGLGKAAELALSAHSKRKELCTEFRTMALLALQPLQPVLNGDPARCMSHVVSLSFPGIDSEAVIVALKDVIAFSNGSACTSHSYEPSHVLRAMGLPNSRVHEAVRFSWCHMTPTVDWEKVVSVLKPLRT